MPSKLVVSRRTSSPRSPKSSPMDGQKLKSERVQLTFQLLPSQREKLRALSHEGGRALVSASLALYFAAAAPVAPNQEGAAGGPNAEAGPALGTPDSTDRPSTPSKEVDHAHT